jgi:hypothetical protein
MRIAVRLDRSRLLRWHWVLISALQQAGHTVVSEFRPVTEPLPVSLLAIMDFDAVRAGAGEERLSDRIAPAIITGLAPASGEEWDVIVDLSTSMVVERLKGRVLRPNYDGSPADEALFAALLAGRAPELAVEDTGNDGTWTIGLPAIEQPTRFAASLDQVTSRLVEGLVRIVADIAAGKAAPRPSTTPSTISARRAMLPSALRLGARWIATKLGRARDRTFRDRTRWHVAWRRVDTDTGPMPGELRLSDFQLLRDDGKRFYADPFVVVRDGVSHVFIEELPDDTGIGVISHFTISATGIATKPAVVLATGTHLSYPFVFEHGGETWMMPESAAAGGLDLYRCRRFPDQWVHEARLLDGRFHDATLFSHEGRLWIAAATEAYQSSTWDALSLFYADDLFGGWCEHARNPVIVDARCARPAGPLWRAGSELLRPAQDCSGGYGSKLSIRRVLSLTPAEFAEEPAGTIAFAAKRRILGPHTLSRCGDLETIDLCVRDSDLIAETA